MNSSSQWSCSAGKGLVVAVLMWLPAVAFAQGTLSVDDRIRLMEAMQRCWKEQSGLYVGGTVGGKVAGQVDGIFEELINAKASAGGYSSLKVMLLDKFAPIKSETTAVAAIEACYRMASGGDTLNLNKAVVPASTSASSSARPTASRPRTPSSVPAPEWSCREPAVYLAASCEHGALKSEDVSETKAVVYGWKTQAVRHTTQCAHSTPSTGFVSTRSECSSKEGSVSMLLENRLEGNGGLSTSKECSKKEVCLTYLGFRVDGGGAEVRIPSNLAGRFDLQVDSFNCWDKPPPNEQKVGLKAEFLGSEIELKPGARFPLTRPGLVELRFQGNAMFEVKHGTQSMLAATTGCKVTLSLQPHQ